MTLDELITWLDNKARSCSDDEMERRQYERIAISLYDRERRIRQLTFIKHTLEELMKDREWGKCAICKFCDGHPRSAEGKCIEFAEDCGVFEALQVWAEETLGGMEGIG